MSCARKTFVAGYSASGKAQVAVNVTEPHVKLLYSTDNILKPKVVFMKNPERYPLAHDGAPKATHRDSIPHDKTPNHTTLRRA